MGVAKFHVVFMPPTLNDSLPPLCFPVGSQLRLSAVEYLMSLPPETENGGNYKSREDSDNCVRCHF